MSQGRPPACSSCGRAIDPSIRCGLCGRQLCHYDIRVYDHENLCPECYENLTFQYRSGTCDISG